MMRMLEAAGLPPMTDGARTADEDNPLGYYELEAVKQLKRDASWLAGAGGKVIKVIHLLLLDLPTTHRYRVVFMQRDLDEVVASQRKMLERAGRSGGSLSPDALKAAYRAQMGRVDTFLASHPAFSRIDVSYNTLVKAPGPVVDELTRFLGLRGKEPAMLAAIDPGLYRNRA